MKSAKNIVVGTVLCVLSFDGSAIAAGVNCDLNDDTVGSNIHHKFVLDSDFPRQKTLDLQDGVHILDVRLSSDTVRAYIARKSPDFNILSVGMGAGYWLIHSDLQLRAGLKCVPSQENQ